jgi:UDP-glucose 4-epimerase
LITGASGFLGFHLVEAALNRQLDVYAAVRKSSDVRHLERYNIQYTYPDFSSIDALKKEIEKNQYSYIIHAAAVTKSGTTDEYNKINAGYTYNIGKAVEMAGTLTKFVFISSLAAIGPSQQLNEVITEHTEPKPVTAYGKSKLLAEKRLFNLSLPLVVLRPTAIYGPGEKDIFILFKSINRGWEPYIGNMQQQLSFVYVKDVAEAAVNALFTDHHGAYNISDGNCYSRYDLADLAKLMLMRKTKKVHIPHSIVKSIATVLDTTYRLFGRMPVINKEKLYELTAVNWHCSIDKAKKELGFEPAYNLMNGLTETFHWYRRNQWL